MTAPAITLWVGGHAWTVRGDRVVIEGERCFSAAHPPPPLGVSPECVQVLLDSGAFSDAPQFRLTAESALERQLAWIDRAASAWEADAWPAMARIVSYDLLIDEVWTGEQREKRRWSVAEAEAAVAVTVASAGYLATQRERIAPAVPVLACQGVDAAQYAECASAVLSHAQAGDVLGLGGWCVLGRWQRWLGEFELAMARVTRLAAESSVRDIHIFGVLWEPALARLVWFADRFGLRVSTDSSAPLLAATRKDPVKAGMRGTCWRSNITWWRNHLANLRSSRWYGPPLWQARLEIGCG